MLSQEPTSLSLLAIPVSQRDTVSRLDMLPRFGNCKLSRIHRGASLRFRTDNAVLATNGFSADGKNFVKRVKQRLEVSCRSLSKQAALTLQWYEHAHHKQMPLKAIARMIQTMLYGRRFFPYYVYNILGGIEEDGELDRWSFPNDLLTHRYRRSLLIRSGWKLRARSMPCGRCRPVLAATIP